MPNLDLTLTGGLTIRVQGATVEACDSLLLNAYVPGITDDTPHTNTPDITLTLQDAHTPNLVVDGQNAILHGAFNGTFPADAYHLLYGMVRRALLMRQLYSVHAACVGCTLLVGHSGMGKTTVALNLIKQHKQQLFSGNKTVVKFDDGVIYAVSGTPTITGKTVHLPSGPHVTYGNRSAFMLEPNAYATTPPPIRQIVIVRLNEGFEDWSQLAPESALHTLYPFFLDSVNSNVLVGGGAGVWDGSVPIDTHHHLITQLAQALKTLPVYAASGGLGFITQQVMAR